MKQLNFIKKFNDHIEKGKVAVLSTCYEKDYTEMRLLCTVMSKIFRT